MEEQELPSVLTRNLCDPAKSFNCLVSSGRFEKGITFVADTLPESASCRQDSETWARNDYIINRYWSPEDGVERELSEPGADVDNQLDSQSQHLTYGEVTPLGVRQLAYEMGITDCAKESSDTEYSSTSDNRDVVFYDMGSGVGRLVTQMYIDQPDRVARAVGIELAEERHRIGSLALEGILLEEQYLLENLYSPPEGDMYSTDTRTKSVSEAFPIQLIHGDVLDETIDPATTHVYISSLCFPKNVLLALQEKLLRLPNIRVIAALNRLDRIHELDQEQWEERDTFIQMSWGDSMAKIYHKVV